MEKFKNLLSASLLSFQHVLAMFGATVLVPFLTGLDTSIALITAGIGTLLFHLVTGGVVPVFLGSSFAFIGGIITVSNSFGLGYATGSFVAVGAVYIIMALLVYVVGVEKVKQLFPPIVTGPIIIVIGLILAPIAVDMASANWTIAFVTIITVALTGIFAKGFFKLIPIITGIAVGYITACFMGAVDFKPILEAKMFLSFSDINQLRVAPQFSIDAMKVILPIALVTVIEHIGDITTNGAVVGKDFFKKPGLHRTLIGDGLATALAGFIGGPANTTYGENTGVLAVTKNYNPAILRYAACIAICLGFIGKVGAAIKTIPVPVMGGISFVLFGMIASIGVKTLVESKPDLSDMRNSIVVFTVLIIGIVSLTGEGNKAIIHLTEYATLSGLSLAAIVGVTLNGILNILAPVVERMLDKDKISIEDSNTKVLLESKAQAK